MINIVRVCALLCGSLAWIPGAYAVEAVISPQADTPLAASSAVAPVSASASLVVQTFYDNLQNVMKEGEQLGYAGRYKKLEPAIKSAFNLPLMTRFAVGSLWQSAKPEEQAALTSAFSDFSVATYASRFTKYDGEKFTVVGEQATPSGTMVKTTLSPNGAAPVALNYLMKPDEAGNWRIVDVYLDGTISELATRRAEFSSIAKREGMAALVNSLGEKSKHMGPS